MNISNRSPLLKIARNNARIKLYMSWSDPKPQGEIRLYIRRFGDASDFAYYIPLSEKGGELSFEFDELLFSRPEGRYRGMLKVGNSEYAYIQLQYVNGTKLVGASNNV